MKPVNLARMTATRRDFAALALAAPLAWSLGGGQARAQGRPARVIAAGGAIQDYPAGTRGAYEAAIRDGADVIAADVVPSQDGTLWALPDAELSAATDVAAHPAFAGRRRDLVIGGRTRSGWFVQDFTSAELRTLARSPPESRRRGRPPPPGAGALLTFEDLVAVARAGSVATARVIGVQAGMLEPAFFAGQDLAIEPRLAAAIRLAGYNAPAAAMMVASDDPRALEAIGALTRARRVLRLGPGASAGGPLALAAIRAHAEAVAADFHLLLDLGQVKTTPPTPWIAAAHAAGLQVQAWISGMGEFPPPPFHPGDARRLLAALIAAGADAVAGDLAAPIARARGPGG
jgi:glycerophosphoryl diester phosphodiesterase